MAYNTRTVCDITGLTIRQVDYWDRTHFIKPSLKEASGHGTARLYAFIDLVQLKVAKTLIDNGVSLQKIRKSVSWLKKNFPDVEKPLFQMKFLTDGEAIFVLTKKGKEMLDVLARGQLVMTIAIGGIIEDLKGEVKKIGQARKYKVKVRGKPYTVILHPDLEDGGFWVECPALPGCSSQGDTVEEALSMISDGIEGHIEIEAETKRTVKRVAVR